MKIKFLGAAGTVTGSSYILTSGGGTSILIDLGMFQGPTEIDKLNYLPYDYDVSTLSGAILTHAHLDHCGRLPIIMSRGFNEIQEEILEAKDRKKAGPTAESQGLYFLKTDY